MELISDSEQRRGIQREQRDTADYRNCSQIRWHSHSFATELWTRRRRYTAWAGEETECLLRGRAPPGGAGGSLHPACGASTPPRTREEPAHVAIDAKACTVRRRQARCSAKSLCSGVRGVQCRARRPVVRTTR